MKLTFQETVVLLSLIQKDKQEVDRTTKRYAILCKLEAKVEQKMKEVGP